MKLLAAPVAVALVVASCMLPREITSTSNGKQPQTSSEILVEGTMKQAQWVVVEKLANRGFPLVDRRDTPYGVWLKFAGNRDFNGTYTLGSAFYAWLEPIGPHTVRLRMVGKPTIDHNEGCPAMDGTTCKPLTTYLTWGVTGAEEAIAIHGMFSELEVDGVVYHAGSDAASNGSAMATR